MSEALGKPFVLDFKPGAGSTVGSAYVAKSPPDGYTLLVVTSGYSITAATYKDLSYDPLKDLLGVTMTIKRPTVLMVHPSMPMNNFEEYINYVRANPGKFNFGTSGAGGLYHLMGQWMHSETKTKVTFVNYKGASPMFVDLVAGRQACALEQKLMPLNLDVRDTRGFIFLKLGDPRLAVKEYNDALDVDPNRPLALYGRGIARSMIGETREADADKAAAPRTMVTGDWEYRDAAAAINTGINANRGQVIREFSVTFVPPNKSSTKKLGNKPSARPIPAPLAKTGPVSNSEMADAPMKTIPAKRPKPGAIARATAAATITMGKRPTAMPPRTRPVTADRRARKRDKPTNAA